MHAPPLVSVIIPTYQRPLMLRRALQSVMMQSYPNKELVVVDDNGCRSSQGQLTAKLIADFTGAPLEYIQHETNRGACAARNTGIGRAQGKYITFLDDDDRWLPEFLETLVGVLEAASPATAVAYCGHDTVYSDADVAKISRAAATARNTVGYSGNVRRHLFNGWCPAGTSLFVIRRDALLDEGGFDERLQSFQDYDLWLRLSANYEFLFVASPLVKKFAHSGSQISQKSETRFAGFVTFFQKWSPQFEECVGGPTLEKIKEGFIVEIQRNRFLEHLIKREYRVARQSLTWLLRHRSVTTRNKLALTAAMVCGPKFYATLKKSWLRLSGGALRSGV